MRLPTFVLCATLWLACGALMLFALYCLLALIQAGSLYTGERAQANVRFWGPLAITSAAGAIACAGFARRTGRKGPR